MKKFKFYFLLFTFYLNTKADWVQVNNGLTELNVNALTASGNYLFAGTLYAGGNIGGVYRSSDMGLNWTLNLYWPNDVWALTTINNYIYVGNSNGVGYTTNNGNNWYPSTAPVDWTQSIALNVNNVYVGTKDSGIYISTNNGTNWFHTSLNNVEVNAIVISGNNIFAGVGGSPNLIVGVFKSTDNGNNWIQTSLNNTTIWSLAINGNYIYAGTSSFGIYISSNNGINWIQTLGDSLTIQALLTYGNNIFAGTGGGVYVSTDNGITWIYRNEGMSTYYVRALCISNNYIFAGTDGHGVFKRPLYELLNTKILSEEIPKNFKFYQNYPNPFNPQTNLDVMLPYNSKVNINIFDILGRKIETIINEDEMRPGEYKIIWNGNSIASGIYFCKLNAIYSIGNKIQYYTQTLKLMLIK